MINLVNARFFQSCMHSRYLKFTSVLGKVKVDSYTVKKLKQTIPDPLRTTYLLVTLVSMFCVMMTAFSSSLIMSELFRPLPPPDSSFDLSRWCS